jgi:hypothetical protein
MGKFLSLIELFVMQTSLKTTMKAVNQPTSLHQRLAALAEQGQILAFALLDQRHVVDVRVADFAPIEGSKNKCKKLIRVI